MTGDTASPEETSIDTSESEPPSEPSESEQLPTKRGKKRSSEKTGFRKAPGAPKRFKSPYILFSIDRMDKYRKEMGSKTKVTSISKLVSDEWKALPEEERRQWEEKARLDKERYNAEKSLYTGPWQIPSKRSRKDPSAPKRPMSAFLFYSQGKRQELKAENPGMKNTEISRLLGDMWKAAPEEERRPHIEREKREREVYNKDIAEWRKQKDDEEKAIRKHRQEVAEKWIQSGYQTHGTGFASQVYAPGIVAPVNGAFVQVQGQQAPFVTTAPMAPTFVPPGADFTYFAPVMAANPSTQQQGTEVAAHMMFQPSHQGQQLLAPPPVAPVSAPAPATAPEEVAKVPTPPAMIPEAPTPIVHQPLPAPPQNMTASTTQATTTTAPPAPLYNYYSAPFDFSQQQQPLNSAVPQPHLQAQQNQPFALPHDLQQQHIHHQALAQPGQTQPEAFVATTQ